MNILKKFIRYFSDSDYRFLVNREHGVLNRMPDEAYLKKIFRIRMGYEPDLEHPETYSEKLQWLKLHDRDPRYTVMVDKYAVKAYVSGLIGSEFIIPTLAVYDDPDKISLAELPDRFVLKCTHDSHSVLFCEDKSTFDLKKARKYFARAMKKNYYYRFREWPYKDVKPRIIAEPYLKSGRKGLTDYKVFCFDGEPKMLEICTGRFEKEGLHIDFYDTGWNRLPIRSGDTPNSKEGPEKPACLEEILSLSRILSAGLIHIRCDFYIVREKVFFGELTFYRSAGLKKLEPESWEKTVGSWIRLPQEV